MQTGEMENQVQETTTESEIIPEQSEKSQKNTIKLLTGEIKQRVKKYATDEKLVIEKQGVAVVNAIRIGFLIRDLKEEIKVNGKGITFKEWLESNFGGNWSTELANHLARLSRNFHIDIEYAHFRERCGIDRLLEAPSDISLERQISEAAIKSSFTGVLRGVGLLPGKAAATNGDEEAEKPKKTQEEKVLYAFERFKAHYLQLRTDIDLGGETGLSDQFVAAIKSEFEWVAEEYKKLQ